MAPPGIRDLPLLYGSTLGLLGPRWQSLYSKMQDKGKVKKRTRHILTASYGRFLEAVKQPIYFHLIEQNLVTWSHGHI